MPSIHQPPFPDDWNGARAEWKEIRDPAQQLAKHRLKAAPHPASWTCTTGPRAMSYRAYVYILASGRNSTLYVGFTNNLSRRVWEHKQGHTPGFTTRYGVVLLVWYEGSERIIEAREREFRIKRWRREWKPVLIEAMNPDWRDLYVDLNG